MEISPLRDLGLLAMGGLLALLGRWVIYRMRRVDERNGLRDALRSEIESTDLIDSHVDKYGEIPESYEGIELPKVAFIPREAYMSNANKLGLLGKEERRAVIGYYSWAGLVTSQLELLTSYEERDVSQKGHYKKGHQSLVELKRKKDNALERLQGSSDERSTK